MAERYRKIQSGRHTAAAAIPPTIDTLEDIAAGIDDLVARCSFLARAYAVTGPPPLRREPPGFANLTDIIVSQLVSLAAADAISARLRASLATVDPASVVAAGEAGLRDCGLTGAKARTLLGLADAIIDGRFDLDELSTLPDHEAHARLVSHKGIGPWTADIYLMFCLGRRDGFAPGDLALRVAIGTLLALPERPSINDTMRIAERWRPWRGVAARLLWAYYRTLKPVARQP